MDWHVALDVFIGLVGVAAVVVPAVWWGVRRIEVNREKVVTEFLDDNRRMQRLDRIDATLDGLAERLTEHMDSEDRLSCKIADVQQEILELVRRSSQANAQSHHAIIKSYANTSGSPVSLYEWKDGDYHYLWGNKEYHDMLGMSAQEARAGDFWRCVCPKERDMFQHAARDVAARAQTLEIDWHLVDPVTGAPRGHVFAVSEYLPSEDDDRWFYVATYRWHKNGTDESSTRDDE